MREEGKREKRQKDMEFPKVQYFIIVTANRSVKFEEHYISVRVSLFFLSSLNFKTALTTKSVLNPIEKN